MTDPKRKRLLELDANGKSTFVYRNAANTSVADTFDRIRAEMQQAKPRNVCPLKARKAG